MDTSDIDLSDNHLIQPGVTSMPALASNPCLWRTKIRKCTVDPFLPEEVFAHYSKVSSEDFTPSLPPDIPPYLRLNRVHSRGVAVRGYCDNTIVIT